MSLYVSIINGMEEAEDGDILGFPNDVIAQEGVVSIDDEHLLVEENGTPNMSVIVNPGVCWVPNDSWTEFSGEPKYWRVVVDAQENPSISSNASGSTRVDLICVKVDDSISPGDNGELAASIEVVEGTPGAGTPATPGDHLVLAEVDVANGASSITNSEITDSRTAVGIDAAKVIVPGGTPGSLLTVGNDGEISEGAVGGKRAIYIAATSMWPSTTNGCASPVKTELGTNDVDIITLDFDQTTQEYAQFSFRMPGSWDGGTFTFIPAWTASSGSGTVSWELQARSFANDDALDQAWGTEQASLDTYLAANDLHEGPESSAITPGGGAQPGEYVHFRITRDTGADTLTADAKLIGIYLKYDVTEIASD